MRTTVDIPDELYRELKSRAAANGQSVKQLLLRGAESILQKTVENPVRRRLKLPLIDSDNPGSLRIDNQQIYDLIDFP